MTGLVPAFIAELSSLGVQSIAEAIDPRLGKVVGFFKGVWKRYRGKQKKAEERAEVERLARLTAAQVVAEVRPQLVAAFPGNVKLQQEGELYFAQMPGAVQASLKRKDDPSGRSAPADHDLDTPEKLAVLFPAGVPQLRPGDDLPRRKGVWKLLDLIGAGGFGEVWKVRNALTKQFAAAKFCTDPNARLDHIRHELEQALRLNHDDHGWPAGMVPVLEFDLDGDHPWILFQFIEGGTLEEAMHELAADAVSRRVARAVPLLTELADAVAPLHALSPPLVHRDLKPANVLRDAAGKLMVTDLGLGGSAVEYELGLDSQGGYHSRTGRLPSLLQGSYSLHYASKQQRAGDRPTTPDDVYALGVIAYQMLAGKLDTGPGTDADDELKELGVPEPLVKLVKACASDDPKRRPANAAALVERLKALTLPPVPVPQERKAGEQQTILLPGNMPMTFAWCPPGTFLMGSPETEIGRNSDEQQHEVTLTKGFWVGIYPVTQAQWRAVMGTDPSHFQGDTLPVECVSWEDTQTFCAELKQKGGVEVRMPTEAEWEYAARGGTTTPFYWGTELNGTQANCDGNKPYGTTTKGPSLGMTTPVGSYLKASPHPWGLCDVLGNVFEWCADWYDAGFYGRSEISRDPQCDDCEQSYLVLRGGGGAFEADRCRAASRGGGEPSRRSRYGASATKYWGFRLCMDEPQG